MSTPKSVCKFSKNGVEYTSNVDHAMYNIYQLSRRAMYDVGKFLARECNAEASKLRGMKPKGGDWHGINRRVRGKTSTFKYNVPFSSNGELPHLEIGVKHDTWYGVGQELGKYNVPKLGILRNITYKNIKKIREIEAQYLTGVDTEADIVLNGVKDEGADE